MPRKVGDSILKGAEEALVFARGGKKGYRVLIPEEIDVRQIRTELGLSQAAFAAYFGVSRRTVQEWEQGRRVPTGPAKVLLTVISREPEAVLRALAA